MKTIIHLPFLFVYAFVLMVNYSKAQTTVPTFTNVDYVGSGNIKQMMDIYIPPGTTTKKPLIMHIHGGGWYTGAKGAANVPFFQGMYNAGYIVADINYRLSGDSVFPEQIYDCKTALRY